MTYGEANRMALGLLRGDNTGAQIEPLHYRVALTEIATRCEPSVMTAPYTGSETDVFRLLPPKDDERNYIKTPTVPDPLDESLDLPVDESLALAVVYFVCSFLSGKYRDAYEKKADKIISTYTSNVLP